MGGYVYPGTYYYYGQFENGLRNGHGLWISAASIGVGDSYTYEGTWANDLPNGEGRIVEINSDMKMEITGSFKNGLYHGTILEVLYRNDESILAWSPITAINGIFQPIEESDNDGSRIVAYDQNDDFSFLGDDGSAHAIWGVATD